MSSPYVFRELCSGQQTRQVLLEALEAVQVFVEQPHRRSWQEGLLAIETARAAVRVSVVLDVPAQQQLDRDLQAALSALFAASGRLAEGWIQACLMALSRLQG